MRAIRKSFGPVVALDQVELTVQPGEILGLLGGNGAGKTTLMNVLFGLYKPDGGEIMVNGRAAAIQAPKDALAHGIGMVHQHFLQVNDFTVLENIVLGSRLANTPRIQLGAARRQVYELAHRFGLEVDPDAPLAALPMGIRQRVEILKALYRKVRLLILDEPTTMLTPQEVDQLFGSLRALVTEGLSVIFITHKLREVMSVCDRITVLRNGRTVLNVARAAATEVALVEGMVGDAIDAEQSLLFSGAGIAATALLPTAVPRLTLDRVGVAGPTGGRVVNNGTFTLHCGEILGIAGVAGNGQRELAEAILGLRPLVEGTITLDGTPVTWGATAQLLQQGVAYLPEDRMDDGILPKASVAQNLILGLQRRSPYSQGGLLNWRQIMVAARTQIAEFNIKTPSATAVGANLSGGNMQRVMLARALTHQLRLLIAHNPTQGLDLPSIEFVYRKILNQKATGMATLLISENLDELFLLCNRIGVLYRGELMGILERAQFDRYTLGRLMSGAPLAAVERG